MARWRQPRGPRKAGLSKLGTLDREHTGAQIHVRQRELARFAEAQACDAQQAEQTVVRPWPQATLARQRKRRLEQASDLRVRVEIRARSLRAIRQQARGRDLRPGIGRTSMPRKP